MKKLRLRKGFFEIGAGIVEAIFPQMASVQELMKQLGFTSPVDPEKLAEIEKLDPTWGIKGFSHLTAVVGSPMGFLPFMTQLYTAGLGQKHAQEAQRVYTPSRLNIPQVLQAWLRGIELPEGMDNLFDDLSDQGFDADRIEILKKLAEFIPPPQDLINWQAKEVFEPKAIEKYGLDAEFEELDLSLFAKVGVTEEQALNYWRAHWQHASWTQIIELRRRELITDDDVWEWFRLVEIPPYWRKSLMELVWQVPTRVDVRRWWDMGTIDEERLKQIYGAQGYHGKNLDDYVLWTKVYVAFPDLISRYKNAWISEEEVKAELKAFGMPEERIEVLWQTKFKNTAGDERVEGTRQLTRALIIKGAKKGILSRAATVSRLMDLNYAKREADYIYAVEVEAAESPETPLDFERLTNEYRRSRGLQYHEVTEEAIAAEKSYLDAYKLWEEALKKGAPQAEVAQLEALKLESEARFTTLLRRSEA